MNKNEIYNGLNWDAKLFLENKIIKDTTFPLDKDPLNDNSKLNEYKDQILDLYNKNILFFIKTLYDFANDASFIISSKDNIYDKDISLLNLLNINVKELNDNDADITIEFIDYPSILFESYIRKENVFFTRFDGNFKLITCERNNEETTYMIVPDIYYYADNEEMKNIYQNMLLHFDEYDNLTFSEDYHKYLKYFLTIKIIEN